MKGLRQPTVEMRVVEKVERGEKFDTVKFEDGWSMGLPADAPVRPEVGTVIEMHMLGTIRAGYAINGVVCEDPDPLTHHIKWRLHQLKSDVVHMEEFLSQRAERDARVAALPEPLRNRIQRFRTEDADFAWRDERYEMAAVEEAARFLDRFESPEELTAFAELDWKEQIKIHPNLDQGHSGNTFASAVHLARAVMRGDPV